MKNSLVLLAATITMTAYQNALAEDSAVINHQNFSLWQGLRLQTNLVPYQQFAKNFFLILAISFLIGLVIWIISLLKKGHSSEKVGDLVTKSAMLIFLVFLSFITITATVP